MTNPKFAKVPPVVTLSDAKLAANAACITITGCRFDRTPANNSVVFNAGAVGTVTAASPTSLMVTFSTKPATAGALTAIVTSDNIRSGSAVQVATVIPVITTSIANRAADVERIVINGFGFDPAPANNSVVFNNGAVGNVTAASPTSLTVTFSTKPATAGTLTAIVTSDNISNGSAVQVATVIPVVTASVANLPADVDRIVINGFGFDPAPANNSVVFKTWAVGNVTAASPTSLTVSFSKKPTSAGSLTVVVTTNKISSGEPVQVATIASTPEGELQR